MFPSPLIHIALSQARHDELIERREPRRPSWRRPALRLPAVARRFLRGEGTVISSDSHHFAHRQAAGITVDLYWMHRHYEDTFRVDVFDRSSRTAFTLRPTTGKEALDAFYHPFARVDGVLSETR